MSPQDQIAFRGFDKLPDAAHARLPVFAALEGISLVTAWRWVKCGKLPQTRKIGNVSTINVGEYRRVMRAAKMGGAK